MSIISDFPASRESNSRCEATYSLRPQSVMKRVPKLQVLLVALLSISSEAILQAQEVHWNGNAGNGLFFDDNNWSPVGAPQIHDVIRIGNLPGTAGDDVVMGGNPTVLHGGLHLSNGVSLDTNGTELVSFDVVSLFGNNTRLIARPAAGPNMSDLQGQIQLHPGTFLELHDNVSSVFFPFSWSFGTISGRGTMITNDFDNSGVIRPGNNGGIVLNAGQIQQDLAVDLDGSSGNGSLQLTNLFGQLQVNAGSLTDTFSGSIAMAPGALLQMNIMDGWTTDANSLIAVSGFNNAANSILTGSHLTFGGTMNVGLAEGKLLVQAPITIQPSASINVGHTDSLRFSGSTTVQGGTFSMGQFATLEFNGTTHLSGGSLNSFAPNYTDGSVVFNGQTFWQGNVTLGGSARQQGNAHVSGGLGATINANLFDMDGLSGNTIWDVNSALTVNADQIGTTGSNRFGGTMNISGGALSRVTMNLSDPTVSWIMSGVMNLAGSAGIFDTRVAGSHMIVQGDLNINSGRVRINADTTFSDSGFAGPASVNLENNDSYLRMHGNTVINSNVEFLGDGVLVNATSGDMRFDSGLNLDGVSFENGGHFNIDQLAGVASVHSFENLDGGNWLVDIGGYLAGAEHDLLLVGAEPTWLDGFIHVNLLDLGLGNGVFTPTVGDTFTILSSLGGVNGSFVNDPTTIFGFQQFHWDVIYNPHDVQLQLAAISVPEPSAIWLLGTSIFAIGLRRRSSNPKRRAGMIQ